MIEICQHDNIDAKLVLYNKRKTIKQFFRIDYNYILIRKFQEIFTFPGTVTK